jgi:hypothetical protein
MCVSIFYTILSKTFLILRRIQRDTLINVYRSSRKVTVILVGFQWNLNFLERFKKKSSNIKFHQNLSSGSGVVPCGRTDRWTDMTKLIFAFHNFVNAPKKRIFWNPNNPKDITCIARTQWNDFWSEQPESDSNRAARLTDKTRLL